MNTLKVENFKCFASESISLNSLTILCGPNAGGKSTLIQALLLHRLATEDKKGTIAINGPFGLQLGDADELYSRATAGAEADERIEIALTGADGANRVVFLSVVNDAPRRLKVEKEDEPDEVGTEPFEFVYLSAERLGPRTTQESYSDDRTVLQTLGHAGEFSAEVLQRHERTRIRENLRSTLDVDEGTSSHLLLRSMQDWMSTLFGPTEIQTRTNGNAPPSIYFKRPGIAEDWTIASNTGFGLSYALPVILAGLLVPEGGTLIVDSPEAHLHPAAQTAIAKFLCRVAAAGVRVILETHSDYILDGVRIALTAPSQHALRRDECTFLSLSFDDEHNRQIEEIFISDSGKPSAWPRGFFDQQIINMKAIDDNVRGGRNAGR